jgi:uncharacterized membrane protein
MDDIFYCTTDKVDDAKQLVDRLLEAGFKRQDLTLLIPESSEVRQDLPHDDEPKTELNTTFGTLTNGLIGGALGLYVGVICLVIPGIGLVLAASPLAIMLGATVAGATAGAVIGGVTAILMKAGMPESEARRHEEMVRQGKTLLVVHTQDQTMYAKAMDLVTHSGFSDLTLSAHHAGSVS